MNIKIEEIRELLIKGEFYFSLHAATRVVERNISEKEISEAGNNAIIIENYPDDKYSPSCLLLGFTKVRNPLHIQVAKFEIRKLKIINIYRPDANEWFNNLKERVKNV
jgi:hypothetical protein